MLTRWRAAVVVLVAWFGLCWGVVSGAPQQPPPRFRSSVEAVVLDVSVLDRNGQPVRGLVGADFTVLEDGQPQKISTFSAVDLPDVERTGTTWLRDVPRETRSNQAVRDAAIIVLLMDDAVMSGPAGLRVQDYAKQVIDELGPNDLAAVVYIVNKRLGQAFTSDRSRLLAAVERYRVGGGGAAIEQLAPRMLTDTVGELADGLAALPGRRKSIVFISSGFDVDFAGGMPDSTVWSEALRAHHMASVSAEFLALFDRVRLANVGVYCLDPTGLSAEIGTNVRLDFLKTLSGNTGGFTVADTNDPHSRVAQIFRENASYYVVGYQPSNARSEGRFRKVEVRVNRPNVTVRTRSGYLEPTGAARSASARSKAANPLRSAMSGFFPTTEVPMQVTAAPFAVAGRREAAVAVVVLLQPTRPVGTQTAGVTAAVRDDVEVLVNAYDFMGDLRGTDRLRSGVQLRPDAGDRYAYEVLARVDLRPGRYQVRLAATAGGKTGSVYYDVDVPDFLSAPLSLSGVVLTATPAVAAAPKDRLRAVIPLVPTARRDFTVTDHVAAFLRVYQGGKTALASVAVRARILDASGAEVHRATHTLDVASFATARSADWTVDVPLAGLRPGPHLLAVEATMGGRTERRDVRFVVR